MAPYAEFDDRGTNSDPVTPGNVEFLEPHSEINSLEVPAYKNPIDVEKQGRSFENLLLTANMIENELEKNPNNKRQSYNFSQFCEFLENADENTRAILVNGLFYASMRNEEGEDLVVLAYPTKKVTDVSGYGKSPDKFVFDMIELNRTRGEIRHIVGPDNYLLIDESPTKYIIETLRGHAGARQYDFDADTFINSFNRSAPVIYELSKAGLFDTRKKAEMLQDTFSKLSELDPEATSANSQTE
jgi:hypothetical protein